MTVLCLVFDCGSCAIARHNCKWMFHSGEKNMKVTANKTAYYDNDIEPPHEKMGPPKII